MQSRSTWSGRSRCGATAAMAGVSALALAGCVGLSASGPAAEAGGLATQVSLAGASYSVGGKKFDEQWVLCEIAVAALESVQAKVTNKCSIGGTDVTRQALLSGEIDLYYEYTGTAWVSFFKQTPIPDSLKLYQAVKERDQQQNQVVWLTPTPFSNTYAFAVHEARAAQLGLVTLDDMARYVTTHPAATVCVDREYKSRDDGLLGLEKAYDFQIPPNSLKTLDPGVIYQATADAQCLFGEVFTTDGRIPALRLRVLKDPKNYHIIYNAAVTIRQQSYDQNPRIAQVFQPISQALTEPVMLELNRQVAAEGKLAREVTRDWLRQQGFIG